MKIRMPKRLTSLILAGALSTGLACAKLEENNDTKTPQEKRITIIEDTVISIRNDDNAEIEMFTEKDNNAESEIINYLELSYYVTAISNVNIREEANNKAKKVGMLFKGQSLKMINEAEEWYEVEYDGKIAYINKEYLEITESYEFPVNKSIPFINSNNEINSYLNKTTSIEATAKVNVRSEANTNCSVFNQLSKGDTLPLISDYNDEWYEVNYNGNIAYVFKQYAKVINNYTNKNELSDIVFMISKTPLYNIDDFKVIKEIPKNEIAKVYAQTYDYYLVSVNGTFGYVSKEHSQSLGDNYVIIDISSQNLKVYVDDKVIIDTPIVTGKDSTPTYCGVFDVYKKEENVYWPEFNVTVRYGLAFNRGEWMHDASWRKSFGGEEYHKKGSHGCVNISSDVMDDVFENVEIGTPVLVKR